jgi:hypothetical protein
MMERLKLLLLLVTDFISLGTAAHTRVYSIREFHSKCIILTINQSISEENNLNHHKFCWLTLKNFAEMYYIG